MATNGDTGSNYAGEGGAFTEYTPSNYKWTDPPRFFKANDPYWYQLDNLPLKRIHENCKWLKYLLGGALGISRVGRSDLDELQPYSTGATESWNGSNWTELTDLSIARYGVGGAGASNSSALCFAGNIGGPPTTATEAWNAGPQTLNFSVS